MIIVTCRHERDDYLVFSMLEVSDTMDLRRSSGCDGGSTFVTMTVQGQLCTI